MNEFFLYDRALTAKEVVPLATVPVNPFPVDAKAKLAVSWAQIKDEQ